MTYPVDKSLAAKLWPFLKLDDSNAVPKQLNILSTDKAQLEYLVLLSIHQWLKQQDEAIPIVLILSNEKQIRLWRQLIEANFGPSIGVLELAASHFWGSDRYVNQSRTLNQRVRTIGRLATSKQSQVVLGTLPGVIQSGMTLEHMQELCLSVKLGHEYDQEELVDSLRNLGYIESEVVSSPGEFARRGGIVDVFSLIHDHPKRIEFMIDQVESIRSFNAEDQKSFSEVDNEIILTPSMELEYSQSNRAVLGQKLHSHLLGQEGLDHYERQGLVDNIMKGFRFPSLPLFFPLLRESNHSCSLIDQLNPRSQIFCLEPVPRLIEKYNQFLQDQDRLHLGDLKEGTPTLSPLCHFESHMQLSDLVSVQFGNPYEVGQGIRDESHFKEELSIESSLAKIRDFLDQDYTIVTLIQSKAGFSRISSLFDLHQIPWEYSTKRSIFDDFDSSSTGKVYIVDGDLSGPIRSDVLRKVVFPEHSFLEKRKREKSHPKEFRECPEFVSGSKKKVHLSFTQTMVLASIWEWKT